MTNFLILSDMCSLIASTVNTFDNKAIVLEKIIKPNCSVLLVADCSISPRFAVFVTPVRNSSDTETLDLEFHIDDRIVRYSPSANGNDSIRMEDSSEIEITTLINPLGDEVEFR